MTESATALDSPCAALRAQLRRHAAEVPSQDGLCAEFSTMLETLEDPFERSRVAGHFTGSAWLVSADGRRALLTHHRKLERWLQLGGHADGDRDLARVALREAQEESGLEDLMLESPAIFDLDKHWIPARGQVEGHWHYDVRYVVRARGSEQYAISEESLDLAWRDIEALADEPDGDPSLQRMARRWLARR